MHHFNMHDSPSFICKNKHLDIVQCLRPLQATTTKYEGHCCSWIFKNVATMTRTSSGNQGISAHPVFGYSWSPCSLRLALKMHSKHDNMEQSSNIQTYNATLNCMPPLAPFSFHGGIALQCANPAGKKAAKQCSSEQLKKAGKHPVIMGRPWKAELKHLKTISSRCNALFSAVCAATMATIYVELVLFAYRQGTLSGNSRVDCPCGGNIWRHSCWQIVKQRQQL